MVDYQLLPCISISIIMFLTMLNNFQVHVWLYITMEKKPIWDHIKTREGKGEKKLIFTETQVPVILVLIMHKERSKRCYRWIEAHLYVSWMLVATQKYWKWTLKQRWCAYYYSHWWEIELETQQERDFIKLPTINQQL